MAIKESTLRKYKLVIDEWFVNGFNGTKAHQKHYPNSGDDNSAKEFHHIVRIPKIQEYKEQKQKEVAEEIDYKLKDSIEEDRELIVLYKSCLDVLQNPKSKDKEIEASERTIKFIGSSAYNSAKDRLSKQLGFFEKDNKQKKAELTQILNNDPLKSDED